MSRLSLCSGAPSPACARSRVLEPMGCPVPPASSRGPPGISCVSRPARCQSGATQCWGESAALRLWASLEAHLAPVGGPSSSNPGLTAALGSGWRWVTLLRHRRPLEATAAPQESLFPAVTRFCFLSFSIYKRDSNSWHCRHKIGYFKPKLLCPRAWEVGGKGKFPNPRPVAGTSASPQAERGHPETPLPALSCTPEEGDKVCRDFQILL